MTPTDFSAAASQPPRPSSVARRMLACIRFDEVAVLQGAPLLGGCYALQTLSFSAVWPLALLLAGNLCLVAHVFVLNDWAGIEGDTRDPHRAGRTFLARGARPHEAAGLAIALLALALLLFSALGATTFILGLAIAGLSALYSAPGVHCKGTPVFNSLLHLCGGTLHFLLGYSALSWVGAHSVAVGCYFGIVFAAGHLTHEARDHDGDLLNGIRTNAVTFGVRPVVLASLMLFSIAYALLAGLALTGVLPRGLALTALLYPVHLGATLRALKSGPDFAGLRQLQVCYRRIHAVIGLIMLLALAHRWSW